jgi:catechol 2,3-dioxygenase-like lactoylglutathione lyase family enzyme
MNRPRVNHIGIIVEDLEESIDLFRKLFNIGAAEIKEIPDAGNIDIECIEYLNEKPGLGERVMGRKSGLNHISFEVKDMTNTLEEFQRKGLKVMEGFPRQGSHGQVAFFEPATTGNILLEICEND